MHHVCGKDYIWNPATCSCENGKYSGSIMDNSYGEETKTIPTNFNEKKATCKTQKIYIYLHFY